MPLESRPIRAAEPRSRVKNDSHSDRPAGTFMSRFLREEAPIILPIAVSIFIVEWFFSELRVEGRMPRPLFMTLFISSVSILSLFLGLVQEKVVRFFIEPSPTSKTPKSRGARLLRGTVLLVLLPMLVSLAFEALRPPVTKLVQRIFGYTGELSATTRIANAVLSSSDLDTKKAGITLLGHIDSADSLVELKRILENEKDCFTDSDCYSITVEALDASEDKTMPELMLSELVGHLNEAKNEGAVGALGIDQRYFQSDFKALQNRLRNSAIDSKSKDQDSAKLEELEAQLTTGLSGIKQDIPKASEKTVLVELILDAYCGIKPSKFDANAKYIARQIAEDWAYSSSIRAKAIAVVGHLGQGEDEEWLLKWVDGREEEVRVAALKAFDELEGRIRHSKKANDTSYH
jgi:hypothetical protein